MSKCMISSRQPRWPSLLPTRSAKDGSVKAVHPPCTPTMARCAAPPPRAFLLHHLCLWLPSHWAHIKCVVAPPPAMIGAAVSSNCDFCQSARICLSPMPSQLTVNCMDSTVQLLTVLWSYVW